MNISKIADSLHFNNEECTHDVLPNIITCSSNTTVCQIQAQECGVSRKFLRIRMIVSHSYNLVTTWYGEYLGHSVGSKIADLSRAHLEASEASLEAAVAVLATHVPLHSNVKRNRLIPINGFKKR